MNSIHIISTVDNHRDFYGPENIKFLQDKIREILFREYQKTFNIDEASIRRVCDRVLTERLESRNRMNVRVIMYLTNEIRNYVFEANKNLHFEENFRGAVSLWDQAGGKGYFIKNKGKPRLFSKGERVGGTLSFNFFY